MENKLLQIIIKEFDIKDSINIDSDLYQFIDSFAFIKLMKILDDLYREKRIDY